MTPSEGERHGNVERKVELERARDALEEKDAVALGAIERRRVLKGVDLGGVRHPLQLIDRNRIVLEDGLKLAQIDVLLLGQRRNAIEDLATDRSVLGQTPVNQQERQV